MRFAVHVLVFNCDRTIVQMLDNCGPFVDKIYAAYSNEPWIYNPKARKRFKNKTDKKILTKSKYNNKIELIEGKWDYDEDQRNACLNRAKSDGYDYLIIHDADEFYSNIDYQKNLNQITLNPNYEIYKTPWCSYWKNLDYLVVDQKENYIVGYPEFAINLHSEVRFIRGRSTNANSAYELSGLCHHLSYVLSDEEAWNKINTWSHSHQFNLKKWYREKWLAWNENTTDLHPIKPSAWKSAKKNLVDKPEILNKINWDYLSDISDNKIQCSEKSSKRQFKIHWGFLNWLGKKLK